MNFESTDYMSDGMIIENLYTTNIMYVNTIAKKFLKIPDNQDISKMSELLTNDEAFESLQHCLKNDFRNDGFSNGKIFLKTMEDSVIEVEYKAFWVEKEKGLISYIFKNDTEVISEGQLTFKEVAEYLPSGVIVLNIEPELSIAYANAENYKIFGITDVAEAQINQPLLNTFIYEEDIDWVITEIYENLFKDLEVDIEFRLKAEDGVLKWIRMYGCAKESTNGVRLFYASIKDLSSRREINDKLHLERVLFHKIAELTNEIMFRIDLETNIIYFFGGNNGIFKSNSAMQNFPQCIIDMDILFSEDVNTFLKLTECFKKGVVKPVEMRILTPEGEFEWYKSIYNFVTNIDGEPLLVTGKLINIQEQKLLEEQAKSDLLTGFLNKITTEIEINEIFQYEQSTIGGGRQNDISNHALFIIDIDFFKSINDNLGHHFGDVVLKEVSIEILRCFRRYDLIGRIGGDEFVVLMKNCKDVNAILNRADMLCKALRKTYYGKNEKYSISASVGIANFPENGLTYEELYKKADIALYNSKREGKNRHTIFNDNLGSIESQIESNAHKGKRLHKGVINAEATDFIFNLLYETKDVLLSINTAIEYIGKLYSIDRCYIYEKDGDIYKKTYSWLSSDKYATKFATLHKDIVNKIFENAYIEGVIYFNTTDEINDSELKSNFEVDNKTSFFAVESAMVDDKHMILGLDICDDKHRWTDSEVRTLFSIARNIISYLTMQNAISDLKTKNDGLKIENDNLKLEISK